jgi:hypothetical protein
MPQKPFPLEPYLLHYHDYQLLQPLQQLRSGLDLTFVAIARGFNRDRGCDVVRVHFVAHSIDLLGDLLGYAPTDPALMQPSMFFQHLGESDELHSNLDKAFAQRMDQEKKRVIADQAARDQEDLMRRLAKRVKKQSH